MIVTGAGGNFFTVVCNPPYNNTLYGVGDLPSGSWVPNFANPGFVPVDCVGGDSLDGAYLFVIDTKGTIQTIGAPDGIHWGNWNPEIFPALPGGAKPQRFVGFAAGVVTVMDDNGAIWSIGNVVDGGEWVSSQNLNPPT
jgi:hypothetical protein